MRGKTMNRKTLKLAIVASAHHLSEHDINRVRKHVFWSAKLRIPEVRGERLARRRSNKLSRVLNYLHSEDCRAQIAEPDKQRRAREQAKKVGKA